MNGCVTVVRWDGRGFLGFRVCGYACVYFVHDQRMTLFARFRVSLQETRKTKCGQVCRHSALKKPWNNWYIETTQGLILGRRTLDLMT